MGVFRGELGEILEILEHRSVEICCAEETRFRGMSVRITSEKAAEDKRGVAIRFRFRRNRNFFSAEKWADKIFDTR